MNWFYVLYLLNQNAYRYNNNHDDNAKTSEITEVVTDKPAAPIFAPAITEPKDNLYVQ